MADKFGKKEKRKSNLKGLLGNIKNELDQKVSNKILPSQETVKNLSLNFADIPIEQIERNPDQPRNRFDETELNDLKASIEVHGLIQPITVRRMAEGQYQIISGERRWRAAKLANLKEIPAYIRIANDAEMMEMALVENTHRADLNPIEIAITYDRLVREFNLTHEELAKRVESSRTSVTNYLRLLNLPEEVKLALKDGKVSMGHARCLVGVDDYAAQVALLNTVISEGLSVRALENIIKKSKEEKTPKEPKKSNLPEDYIYVQNKLSHYLGSKVQLKRDPKSGKGSFTINFADEEDLNRIFDVIDFSID